MLVSLRSPWHGFKVSRSHLVDLVEERVVAAGSLADDREPVGRELVAVWRRLAFGELVDDTRDLDGRLEREGEGVVGLRLSDREKR